LTLLGGAHGASYRHYNLKVGDSDRKGIWSGGNITVASGRPVEEAQIDLKAVGCYDGKLDGIFGNGTKNAVRRFQWALANVDRHIKPGHCGVFHHKTVHMNVTGHFDKSTNDNLHSWASKGYCTTGTLRAVPLSNYPNIIRGTLKALDHPNSSTSIMAVHSGFLGALKSIDEAAKDADIKLKINQAFRVAGAKVTGAVVKPASKSQHLIGTAIDWNIENDSKVILSSQMTYSTLDENVKEFIDAVKKAGLRWGGDFGDTDPIHFDKQVDHQSTKFEMLYYFNQRMVQLNQHIETAHKK
jgi:hypothetical protein